MGNYRGCHVDSCDIDSFIDPLRSLGDFKVDHGHFPLHSNQSLKNHQKLENLDLGKCRGCHLC